LKPGTDKLLIKAERAARVARLGLDAGAPQAAAGRAFYALLYAAKAILNERGLRPHAHVRIAAALPREHGHLREQLSDAIARRRDGEEMEYGEAEDLVERARTCVGDVRRHIR